MKVIVLLSILILVAVKSSDAQPFASWNNQILTLNNGIIKRIIQLPNPDGNFLTTCYQLVNFKLEPEIK